MAARRKKVRRDELITIRATSAEASEFRRLAYVKKATLAKLFRDFVARELAAYDKARGPLYAPPAAAARAKVVPMRRVGRAARGVAR